MSPLESLAFFWLRSVYGGSCISSGFRRCQRVKIELHGYHCLVERRGGERLNKEASWRPLFGGAQGEEKFE